MSDEENEPEAAVEDAKKEPELADPIEGAEKKPRSFLRYLVLVVPLIGLIELLLHVTQVKSTASDADWAEAATAVRAVVQPTDLIVFAPTWVDPLGRNKLGADLITIERAAFPEASRFPRAIEVSMKGAEHPELAGWRVVEERRAGPIAVRVRENPRPLKILDDLVKHVGPEKMTADLEGQACGWTRGSAGSISMEFGPALPPDHFQCSSGPVGVMVMPVLDYSPRRCVIAQPTGGATLRLHFTDVAFGTALRGNHGLFANMERDKTGAPVNLVFKVGERTIGHVSHVDGEGWKPFELSTAGLEGTRGEIVAEVSAANGSNRVYCFEAVTL